jgi:hypothetical protein
MIMGILLLGWHGDVRILVLVAEVDGLLIMIALLVIFLVLYSKSVLDIILFYLVCHQ